MVVPVKKYSGRLRELSILLGGVALLLLSGCAAPQKVSRDLLFWPDSDLPRVQFLMEINSNSDIIEMNRSFSLVAMSEPEKLQFEPLIKPGGVTSHKGKIYVCDAGRSAMFLIDPKNQTFELFKPTGRGTFGKPLNVTFDRDGNMYVADAVRKEVMVFDPQRNFLRGIGNDLDMQPTDVEVDGDYLYVADPQKQHVKVFDRSSGKLLTAIGEGEAQEADRMSLPTQMALDARGAIYATNVGTGRVLKFDRDGHLLLGFGRMGTNFGSFGRPRGIFVDDGGRIYVVDAAHQNVQIFNEQGRLLMFFGGGQMKLPAGIHVTKDNLEYFQTFASPGFELEKVILVTSHFGSKRLGVYGLGKRRGIDYEAEYAKTLKMLEKKKQQAAEDENPD